MRMIRISDVTMKRGGKGTALSFREKIELSKLLDGLGTDVIELEGIDNSRTDALRIKSVAAAVKQSTVAVPVQLDKENIMQVWEALKTAKNPRLQVCAAVSSVQMEYLYHKKADARLKSVADSVTACVALCADVEFVADDATRAEPEYLSAVIGAAIDAGAKTITVCDAAGAMLPEEFGAFVANLYEMVPALKQVALGVSCSNALSLADACAVAAVCQGAGEVKTAAYGEEGSSLANVARIIAARADTMGCTAQLRLAQLSRSLDQIVWMCSTERSKNSPFDSGVRTESADIFLTAHDDIAAVSKAVEQLGYDLSEEDKQKVFDAFCNIAAKKDKVGIRELDAIVASAAMQVPAAYERATDLTNAASAIGPARPRPAIPPHLPPTCGSVRVMR